MIDMLIGLVVLAAFLIFGTMVVLQIEETKLDSLERNDEMAWATMQQSAATQGLQANTGSGLFNEGTYGVASAEGSAIRVNSNTSLGTPLEVGNLVITPRILTISDVPGRKGKVAVGYIMQDCSTAGKGDEIMPPEEPPLPDLSVTLLRADNVTSIATFTTNSNQLQVVDISSDDVSWSDDGHMVLHYRIDGNSADLAQIGAHVDSVSEGVAWAYAIDEDHIITGGAVVGVPFAVTDSSGNTITWTIQYTKLDVTLEQTRSLVNTENVTLTDVSPAFGGSFTSAVGVNQLVTSVTIVGGESLPANFVRAIGLVDTINGHSLTQDESVSVVGQANYNPVASYFTGYTGNVWSSSVINDSAYVNTPDPKTSNLTAVPSSITISINPAGGNYEDGVNVYMGTTYTNAYTEAQLVNGVANDAYYKLRYEVFEDQVSANEGEVTTASPEYAGAFYIPLDPGAEGYVEARTLNFSGDIQYFLDVADASQNYYSEFGPIGLQWGKNNGVREDPEYTDRWEYTIYPWEDTDSWYPEPEDDSVLSGEGENYLMGKLATGDVNVHLLWYYHDPEDTQWQLPAWNESDRPHVLGGLIFNNEDYTYTIMGPDENTWIPMYFNSGDGSRSLISVLNSPKNTSGNMTIYDPHVLNIKLELYNDLELNVSNTSAFKFRVLTIDSLDGEHEIIKTGPGSMYILVTGSNQAQTPIRIEEGRMVCAIDDALPYTSIILDGGEFNVNRRDEGYTNDDTRAKGGVDVESSSVLNMGDGTSLYDGENTQFIYGPRWLNVDEGATLTIKNWDPGSYVAGSNGEYPYETNGGNTKIMFTTSGSSTYKTPSDDSLRRVYFDGWTDYDETYKGGARIVEKNGNSTWQYYLVPPKPRTSKGIGYLNVTEDSHIDFNNSSKLQVEGVSITSGKYLRIDNWTVSVCRFNSTSELSSSTLDHIIFGYYAWVFWRGRWYYQYVESSAVQNSNGDIVPDE
jgi:hypothetical protein